MIRKLVVWFTSFGSIVAAIVVITTPATVSAQSPPNIVLILSDDQTKDSLAAMPFLTSKPGGSWFEFPNAFVNTPICCPTRATLLTGLYSHHHGVRSNKDGPAFDDDSTLATWLSSAGYRTGLAGKYLNHYPWKTAPFTPPGWSDFFANHGQDDHYNYTMNDNGTLVTYGSAPEDYHTDVVARRAETFIRQSAGSPFFLLASPNVPHTPGTVAPRHVNASVTAARPPNVNEADVSDKPAWVQAQPLLSESQVANMHSNRERSFRMVMAVDDLVKTVYQTLQSTGQLDNTVIVFMTDNGFMWGEHRLREKSCVYEECVGTPLFIRYPGNAGRVEPKLVSSVDLAPTLAEIAGIVPGGPVDGMSLKPLMQNQATGWRSDLLLEFAGGGRPSFWAVRTNEWKYVELSTGERELYDMVNDRYEMNNVAGRPDLASVQTDLASRLAVLKAAPARSVSPSLSVSDAEVLEGSGSSVDLVFTVSLSAAAEQSVSVRAATVDGTARAPGDYTPVSQVLSFAAGVRSKTVTVPVAGDTIAEGNETLSLVLSEASGASIADGTGVGLIRDDDSTPGISIGDTSVVEGNSGTTAAVFRISLSAPSTVPVSVSFRTVDGSARSPADYQARTGTVEFQPGQQAADISVSVVGETLREPDEDFFVVLSNAVGGIIDDGTGRGIILTDEPATAVSVSDASVVEGTGASSSMSFTFTLSPAPEAPVQVSWTTTDGTARAPADYAANAATVSFTAGQTSKTVTVAVTGDSVHEADETLFVDVTAATGAEIADGRGVGTIQNDDPAPSITINDVRIVEGNSGTQTAAFTVRLSAPSGLETAVFYTTEDKKAKAPGDYTRAMGQLVFAPGETAKTVLVSIVGDLLLESDETYGVRLSNPSGAVIADDMGVGTIINDDV